MGEPTRRGRTRSAVVSLLRLLIVSANRAGIVSMLGAVPDALAGIAMVTVALKSS